MDGRMDGRYERRIQTICEFLRRTTEDTSQSLDTNSQHLYLLKQQVLKTDHKLFLVREPCRQTVLRRARQWFRFQMPLAPHQWLRFQMALVGRWRARPWLRFQMPLAIVRRRAQLRFQMFWAATPLIEKCCASQAAASPLKRRLRPHQPPLPLNLIRFPQLPARRLQELKWFPLHPPPPPTQFQTSLLPVQRQ